MANEHTYPEGTAEPGIIRFRNWSDIEPYKDLLGL